MGVRQLAVANGPNIFQMLLVDKKKLKMIHHMPFVVWTLVYPRNNVLVGMHNGAARQI